MPVAAVEHGFHPNIRAAAGLVPREILASAAIRGFFALDGRASKMSSRKSFMAIGPLTDLKISLIISA